MTTQHDPFAGVWRLNSARSNFDPNHRPSDATLRFEREDGGYLMRAGGVCDGNHVEEHPQRFITDGVERPVPGAPEFLAMATRPEPNTIRVLSRKGDQVVGEGSYVVSADGGSLTATVRGIDTERRTFETVVVWDRQSE
jgi:hypothetical protein